MTPERIRDAAKILRELGNAKMATELDKLSERYRWRPIAELHEDYGPCVVMNIEDTGRLEVWSNMQTDYEELEWTHFSQIVPLGQEEYENLREAMNDTQVA